MWRKEIGDKEEKLEVGRRGKGAWKREKKMR